ncbi:OmpA family protein [Sporocytophaga myxococcoides]|uniref:OmpA family protein n=1 Tax=Sporocytophaga myxococcoides TaxID=153721 RepID=UPI000404EEB7|nr:OmpA family protein [Sporocytophaga myxococcoides]
MKLNVRFFLILVMALGLFAQANSQDVSDDLREGNRLLKQEHYRNALPFFEKILTKEPKNTKALFGAAVCYLHRYSKEKALTYIEKVYALDSTVDKHIHFWMGRVYHQNYMFDKALEQYNIYQSNLSKKDLRQKDLAKYINQVNTAKEFVKNNQNYLVSNLGPVINSSYSEHSPVTSMDDKLLLFTSRRSNETSKEDLDGEPFEDIFQSKKLDGGKWSEPQKIQLNSGGHDASIQLFDNDTKLLVYKFTKGGDIYYTERNGDKWGDLKPFAGINSRDFEADAFISADGKTAYFATNHYKRNGDLDIYYVKKNADGSWGDPAELRGGINSDEDEDAPFITPDGKTLYFSSRGHKNMGGYDVFKSVLGDSGKWSEPENMGYPINTPDDDVYFYLSSISKKSYISSYREGGFGEKDIYEISYIPSVKINGTVTEDRTGKKVNNLQILFVSTRNTTKPVNESTNTQDGRYSATLTAYNSYRIKLIDGKDTLLTQELDIPFTADENMTITRDFVIPFIQKDSEVAIKLPEKFYSGKFLLRDIHFETGKSVLSTLNQNELDKAAEILKKNPEAKLKIKGSVQTNENPTLAQERSKSVSEYLKGRGVSATQLEVVDGFTDGSIVGLESNFKGTPTMEFDKSIINSAAVGASFILRNVHFETAKWDLNEVSRDELDLLISILKENPTLNIEIGGYTDNLGEDAANQILSEKRAKSVEEYLLNNGIDKSHLSVVGYGEASPLAPNDSEEGRVLNRRTEIRILGK